MAGEATNNGPHDAAALVMGEQALHFIATGKFAFAGNPPMSAMECAAVLAEIERLRARVGVLEGVVERTAIRHAIGDNDTMTDTARKAGG